MNRRWSMRSGTAHSKRSFGCKSQTNRHCGSVKHVDRSKGYGFIQCEEVQALYGSDVFVLLRDLLEIDVGDCVRFLLSENSLGKPQGTELQKFECAGDASVVRSEKPSARLGTIKSFDSVRAYGFISCQETFDIYGRDVFVGREQLQHFAIGDQVSFCVETNAAGHPKACKLTEAPKTSPLPAKDQKSQADDLDEIPPTDWHKGKVKSFSSHKAYGFIECPTLHGRFGRDVFFPISLLPGLSLGDQVDFQVRVKSGQPQASAMVRACAQTPAKVEGQASAALTKKLLRACASSRKESYDEVFGLLSAGADPNGRDVTGQTALMVAALTVGGSERKCRLLVGMGADVHCVYRDDLTVLQWAHERLSRKLANHLEALSRGEQNDYVIVLDTVGGSAEI